MSDNDLNQTKTKEQIIEEKFAHLRGQVITVTEAAEKYNLPRTNILEWVKNGYITVLTPGYRMELDESGVAYCAEIYRQRQAAGIRTGAPLLDENGLPYQLKRPELHEYRRKRRQATV